MFTRTLLTAMLLAVAAPALAGGGGGDGGNENYALVAPHGPERCHDCRRIGSTAGRVDPFLGEYREVWRHPGGIRVVKTFEERGGKVKKVTEKSGRLPPSDVRSVRQPRKWVTYSADGRYATTWYQYGSHYVTNVVQDLQTGQKVGGTEFRDRAAIRVSLGR